MKVSKSWAFLFSIFSLILWIDNSHVTQHWKSKNTINVIPAAVFASLLSQRVCALTWIQYCQVSCPKMWCQFIHPASWRESAGFHSVLPAQGSADLWYLANTTGKTCYLNVALTYISIRRLNPFCVQEPFLLLFISFCSFFY